MIPSKNKLSQRREAIQKHLLHFVTIGIATTIATANPDKLTPQQLAEMGKVALREATTDLEKNRAFAYLLEAAIAGVPVAQSQVAACYYYGNGVPIDYRLAWDWVSNAAKKKDANAQLLLGVMYKEGYAVDKNESLSAEWYKKAAETGHPSAQFELGLMYGEGYGVAKDANKAAEWVGKAAENGLAHAQNSLGRVDLFPTDVID